MSARREDVVSIAKWMGNEYPATSSNILDFITEFDGISAENERLTQKGYELTQKLAHAQVENEELKEESDNFDKICKMVIEEKCPSDELHCTCVPILRMEIDRLKEKVKELENTLKDKDKLLVKYRLRGY